MGVLVKLLYVFLALWTAFVGFSYMEDLRIASSAPQQAAAAGMALASVAIPYVILRSLEKMADRTDALLSELLGVFKPKTATPEQPAHAIR